MRPSVQLPSVSAGADSKLGLTMAHAYSFHSAPDPPAFDLPPVRKLDVSYVFTSSDLDL